MRYRQPLEFIMNMKHASCSARTSLWRDSIFIGDGLVWTLEEESDSTMAFGFPMDFFTSSMIRIPRSSGKIKGCAIHFGSWVLLRKGQPLAYAMAVSEQKPMSATQIFIKSHLEAGFDLALAYLITGILTMSGTDVLQVFLLGGDATQYIHPSHDMEVKDFWTTHLEWPFLKSSSPLVKFRALSLSPSSWENHELGKPISEKLNFLKLRKARWEEANFPKPKKIKRALIARIFRPKITD